MTPPDKKEPKGIRIKSVLNPPDKAIELGKQHAGVRADVGYTVDMTDGKRNEWVVTLTRGHFNDLFRAIKGAEFVNIIEFVFDEPTKTKSSDSEIPVFLEEEETQQPK